MSDFVQVATGLSNMGMMQGHILTQQGGNTYLIQGGTMDGEGTPLAHTTRASPATVSLTWTYTVFLTTSHAAGLHPCTLNYTLAVHVERHRLGFG